jgi:sulfur relay protein TusB/DsrH
VIVYLLGKSPFEFRAIETFLDLGEQQSTAGIDVRIILLHGAVLAGRRKNRFEERMRSVAKTGAKIYLRKEDLDARAIYRESLSNFGQPIGTTEIMKLVAESDTVVSVI